MPFEHKKLLCQYSYDPLDRLVACTPADQASARRFYLKDRLTTETQGSARCSIFQQGDQLLAQQHRDNAVKTTLLATDQQRSVLHALNTQLHPLAYTPYGHRAQENGLLSLLGFNGEPSDPLTGHYLLGNGYRAFNPTLMRFNGPDNLGPFGKGGLNTYAYCMGDPVNRTDPTGNTWGWVKTILRSTGLMSNSIPSDFLMFSHNTPRARVVEIYPPRQVIRSTDSPATLQNTKSAAWTAGNASSLQVDNVPSRRGSNSYYLEGGNRSNNQRFRRPSSESSQFDETIGITPDDPPSYYDLFPDQETISRRHSTDLTRSQRDIRGQT
ncbi:RHS repeat-associated core domain-containing protein [Pseudomonas sp. RGM2987]|uniref:RHS repeat-associated core domain-containing protein n=1 Tax=Pseudomonas sp. RGM2987 TaxID=2930090 RepID=UPI001FD71073|nr:RHS repeat-associated core domain-containing protein [Pseudomonas sp. RGM2987]MCJ8206716.1 RHS repeat-associated core domain-containing protein [Pseudomonas sp. RGM2987]